MSEIIYTSGWDATNYRDFQSLQNEKYKAGNMVYICFNDEPVKVKIEHVYLKNNGGIQYIAKNPKGGFPTWDRHYKECEVFFTQEEAKLYIEKREYLRIIEDIQRFEEKYNKKFAQLTE